MKTTEDIQISRLRSSLNGKVIGAGDPGYDDLRRVVFTGFDRRPAAIVRAADAADVAHVVNLAWETDAELAVRSGGHSRAGHGTAEDCDLERLAEVKRRYDPDNLFRLNLNVPGN